MTSGTRSLGPHLATWLYSLLVVVPVLAFAGGAFFVGQFVSAPDLWLWCGGAALVHAALFYGAVDYKLRRTAGAVAVRAAGVAVSRPLLVVSAFLFLAVWTLDDVFVSAELAWAVGTPVVRTASVVSKSRNRGKGCPYYIYVSAPGGPSDFAECIDGGIWQSRHVGDRIRIRVLESPFGLFVSHDEAYLP